MPSVTQPVVAANQQQQPTSSSSSSSPDTEQAARPTGAGVDSGAGTTRPKTAAEVESDRLYEERMEDEYAKREGGA